MKNTLKKYLPHIVSALILFTPSFIFAEQFTINNPLKSNNVQGILLDIMNLVTMVGSVVVVFMIIYSGFKFVTAGSSDTDRKDAKNIFYATVIGGAILLGADVIARVVVNTVKTTTGVKIGG